VTPDRYNFENELLSAFKRALSMQGLAYDYDSSAMQIARVFSTVIVEVVLPYLDTSSKEVVKDDLRVTPLLAAVKLLGEQVAEHNRVLQAVMPQEQAPTHWQCYCGTVNPNPGVGTCRTCDRRG
jgi:hypothetical protein